MPAPVVAAAPAVDTAVAYDTAEPAGRKSKVGLIAAGLIAVALAAGAVVVMRKPSEATAAAPAAATSTVAAATSTVAPTQLTTSEAGVPAIAEPLTATTGSIDPSLVDAEVQKRIAAERARLEALARAQQQGVPAAAVPAAVAAGRPAVPAPAPQVAQQTPPPAAVPQQQPQQPAPAPAPAQQEPARQPEVAETRPTPAPQQPAAAAAQSTRAGELVAPGTDGLVPPKVLRRGQVPYPAMARAQKVEGTVITNVLVSETGSVLEVRIVRGISRAPALNEAAAAAMRRSSFAPGTKDGVKVKSWITVPVEFKL
jgi:TonB family protein